MNLSYLSRSTIFLLSTLLLFLMLLGKFLLVLFFILIMSGYLFLFRKRSSYFHEDQITTSGNIYAPVSGKVIASNLVDGFHVIEIKTSLINEYGIYLPYSCTVGNITFSDDSSVYRTAKKVKIDLNTKNIIDLIDENKRKVSIQFIRFFTGRKPEVVLAPGDRGRRQVNIGFFPFGGVTILRLPENVTDVVLEGDKVRATETIVARFKNEV